MTKSGKPRVQDQSGQKAPRDVPASHAKNQGHGKKTADKWNQ
jgi:hypothetical protein